MGNLNELLVFCAILIIRAQHDKGSKYWITLVIMHKKMRRERYWMLEGRVLLSPIHFQVRKYITSAYFLHRKFSLRYEKYFYKPNPNPLSRMLIHLPCPITKCRVGARRVAHVSMCTFPHARIVLIQSILLILNRKWFVHSGFYASTRNALAVHANGQTLFRSA